MRQLGSKDEFPTLDQLQSPSSIVQAQFTNSDLTPKRFPVLPSGQSLICGLVRPLTGERLVLCESLEDMLECDAEYGVGNATQINWYFGVLPE